MSIPTTIGCQEALRLLALYLDGELEAVEHSGVEHHLSICRGCYSRAEFERRLKAELAVLRQDPVPEAFDQRIRELMGTFRSMPDQSDC